jgi:hypothetical protein
MPALRSNRRPCHLAFFCKNCSVKCPRNRKHGPIRG